MTEQRFDSLAPAYDQFRTGYSDELFDALQEYGLSAGDRVLDVACGTGIASSELAARGCQVTGIDISEPMLSFARKRIGESTFLLAQAERLPFASATFDAAICAQAFHWLDQPRALAEMIRVVRRGGTIAIFWKQMIRGDAMRIIRDDAAKELGIGPFDELLPDGLSLIEASALEDQRLRVIPSIVTMATADFIGYERSRARAHMKFGNLLERYLELLAKRLMSGDATLAVSYVQYLALGRSPGSAVAV